VQAGCGLFRGKAAVPETREPPVAPAIAQGQLDPHGLIAAFADRAARVGAGAPSLVASAQAVENAWVGAFVEIPEGDCLLSYARGAPSIEDVDVAVYSDEGTSLAVDEGRDVHPTVLLCAPHPRRVFVSAHVVDGEGLVAVGAQVVPRDRAEIVARALGARGGATGGPRPPSAWPGLEDAVHVHRLELGGAWEEFKRVALPVDSRLPTEVSFPIGPDECVDALVLADDGASQLDVEALDADGRVIARARGAAGPCTLTVCSPAEIAGSLSIRPHSGMGLAAVVLGRAHADVARDLSSRADVAWRGASEPLGTARKTHEAMLAKSGYDAPSVGTSGTLVIGKRVSVPLDLKLLGAPCGRIDVIAGAPLGLVDARVRDDAGALLASDRASSSLALFVCAKEGVHLELEALGRPGPYGITVRPERWRDPALAGRSLAASRMLSRSAKGPGSLMDGKELRVRPLSLSADKLERFTETVAQGKCLQVTIGVQGDGAGVELRALDESGADVDRSEGPHAASVRVCAPPAAPKTVRFEARASAGKVDAVLGERLQE
jgi:hypothetical protein